MAPSRATTPSRGARTLNGFAWVEREARKEQRMKWDAHSREKPVQFQLERSPVARRATWVVFSSSQSRHKKMSRSQKLMSFDPGWREFPSQKWGGNHVALVKEWSRNQLARIERGRRRLSIAWPASETMEWNRTGHYCTIHTGVWDLECLGLSRASTVSVGGIAREGKENRIPSPIPVKYPPLPPLPLKKKRMMEDHLGTRQETAIGIQMSTPFRRQKTCCR